MDVLYPEGHAKKIPHRHFVFSIPKILRRSFLYDRKLLAALSRCAWESLKGFIQDAVPENDPIPGAVIAMQTFGDFLGFNPHCHILVTDGCFYSEKGMFHVAPPLELKKLEALFRHNVFKMLLAKGKITCELIAMHSSWKHSGFNVFCGNRISPSDDTAMENLARYIIRASFSQERMKYLDQEGLSSIRPRPAPDPDPGTERQTRSFPQWSGWPQCVRTSRTGESRWCGTTDITATSHGENGRRKARIMLSPASLNHRVTKRHSGKVACALQGRQD